MKTNVKGHIKTLIVCAIFAALGFVLDRFLGITLPLFGVKSLSINISYVPIFLAGFLYGPIWGALVGGVQDILCVLLVPLGAFIPGITVTTMLAGALGGVFRLLFIKNGSFSPEIKDKKTGKAGIIASCISVLSVIAMGVLLFLPIITFADAEGTYKLSVWQTLVGGEEYKSVFSAILPLFDTGDTTALLYSGLKISDTAAGVSMNFTAAVVFALVAVIMFFARKRLAALLSALAGFIFSGVAAATVLLYVPKALKELEMTVTQTVIPYIIVALCLIVVIRIITAYDASLTKLTLFVLIATTFTSVLNSFWISLTYTSVTFWVYLLPRLAAALFIGVPLYTAILWFIMKKAVPQLKKSNLL